MGFGIGYILSIVLIGAEVFKHFKSIIYENRLSAELHHNYSEIRIPHSELISAPHFCPARERQRKGYVVLFQ